MKNKTQHRIQIVLVILILGIQAIAQTSFKPVNLGPNVNTDCPEINPVISSDGKTLYFTRVNHPENTFGKVNTQDIWCSNLSDSGTWSKAIHLPRSINIGRYNSILAALDNSNTFLINGVFNKRGTRWIKRGMSIIEKINLEKWGRPVRLHIEGYSQMNKGKTTTAYMTPDKEYLFLAFGKRPNSNKQLIYVSKHKNKNNYTKPTKLKGGVNLNKSNESPFLSSDKNVIFFSSGKGKGIDNFDIYSCKRENDSFKDWLDPILLCDTINTPNWDSYYKLNKKESWAYYSSLTNSFGKSDIFRVKIFEENPYVKVSGSILNQADQTPLLADTSYQITINGEAYPELKVNKSTASYEVLLPLGELYTIKPELNKWFSISSDIDVRTVREYTETRLNLYVTPVPFVQIKGKIIDTRTNLPVSLERNPKVTINGIVSDSVKYDKFSAGYSIILPLGACYVIGASVPNFTCKADTVDVIKEKVFQEREVDIYVTSFPWVEVLGLVMDNNSFTPITGSVSPKLLIDDKPIDSITINPVSGEFLARLPFGKTYVFAVASPDLITLPNPLDLTGYVEYATIKFNVFAERKNANMATLSGKIINTKTEKSLDPGIIAKIRINGVELFAFRYDSATASYTQKLPVGFSYDVTPSVRNFYNKYEQVDFTNVAPGSKISRNFYVTPIEVGQAVNIEFIYFETGKSDLKPESFRSLNALVRFLNEYPNVKVEIGGHTDNTGSAETNMRLSQNRAHAVADYVISSGIVASRVVSKGYGYTKPKFSNSSSSGRARNRRVEFTITGI
jgi:outer membrane protein OmpA-like peptidoglycan-associated protein